MRHRDAARLALVFTATLLAASGGSLTRAVEIKDGEFGTGWEFVAVQTGTGGSFDATISGGGNPGNQLITRTHINENEENLVEAVSEESPRLGGTPGDCRGLQGTRNRDLATD